MAGQDLRPMGIGDILDVTFHLYRRRFLTFLLIALVVYVPYSLLAALLQMAATGQVAAGGSHAALALFIVSAIGGIIFLWVLVPLCGAAMVHNISASYLGEDISAGRSFARAGSRLLPLLGAQWLAALVIILGCFMLIVPGVIFSLWFLLIVPVVVLESKGGSAAMGRSRELMRDNLGKGFVLGLLVGIIGATAGGVFRAVTGAIHWPHPAIGIFLQTLLTAVVVPIQTAPWTLLYYDLRIRKEAFDLDKLADALGQSVILDPPSAP